MYDLFFAEMYDMYFTVHGWLHGALVKVRPVVMLSICLKEKFWLFERCYLHTFKWKEIKTKHELLTV